MSKAMMALCAAALLLAGCGGGGGRPGECHAGPVTCGLEGGGSGGGSKPVDVTGLWRGTTSNGRTSVALTLSNKQTWVLYSAAGNPNVIAGAGFGTYTVNGNTLTSTDAVDVNLEGLGVNRATIAATVQSKSSINGTVRYPSGTAVSFSATFDAQFATPASTADAAGTYRGAALVAAGQDVATLTVASDGAISGSTTLGCHFTGTATPETNVNVFDLAIQFGGAPCSAGTGSVAGVAYFDAATHTVYAAAVNAARTDGFLFTGVRQ